MRTEPPLSADSACARGCKAQNPLDLVHRRNSAIARAAASYSELAATSTACRMPSLSVKETRQAWAVDTRNIASPRRIKGEYGRPNVWGPLTLGVRSMTTLSAYWPRLIIDSSDRAPHVRCCHCQCSGNPVGRRFHRPLAEAGIG